MNRKSTAAVIVSLFTAILLFANDPPAKKAAVVTPPLKSFLEFKQHILDENFSSVVDMLDGEMRSAIENDGVIPAELITIMASAIAAYENTAIRAIAPEEAQVCIIFIKNKREFLLRLDMKKEPKGYSFVKSEVSENKPEVFFNDFVKCCKFGKSDQALQFFDDELKKSKTAVPRALTAADAGKISLKKRNQTDAQFLIPLSYTTGEISMIKSGYFWKISAISPVLTAPAPWEQLDRMLASLKAIQPQDALAEYFTPACLQKLLSAFAPPKQDPQTDENAAPAETEETDKTDKTEAKPPAPEIAFNADQLAAFNAVRGKIGHDKFINRSGTVNCDIQLETFSQSLSGTISVKFKFAGDKWLIDTFNVSVTPVVKETAEPETEESPAAEQN